MVGISNPAAHDAGPLTFSVSAISLSDESVTSAEMLSPGAPVTGAALIVTRGGAGSGAGGGGRMVNVNSRTFESDTGVGSRSEVGSVDAKPSVTFAPGCASAGASTTSVVLLEEPGAMTSCWGAKS